MEVLEALTQIREIHKHLSKTEIFRGYRPFTIFLVGLSALLLAAIEHFFFQDISYRQILVQWLFLAALIFVIIISGILVHYFTRASSFEKHQTKKILIQFFPSILIGSIISVIFIQNQSLSLYLPGLWAVIFGLGICCMVPYLPLTVYFVVLYYMAAGTILILLPINNVNVDHWSIGLTFGTGNLLSAVILKLYIKGIKK